MYIHRFGNITQAFEHMRVVEEQANSRVVDEQRGITWGSFFIRPHEASGLIVFGHVWVEEDIVSEEQQAGASLEEAEETLRTLRAGYERGYRFGRCYSTVEPEGELGDSHIVNCWPITSEQFLQAEALGWNARAILGEHDWLADALMDFMNSDQSR